MDCSGRYRAPGIPGARTSGIYISNRKEKEIYREVEKVRRNKSYGIPGTRKI
jgi:hypothetical protein